MADAVVVMQKEKDCRHVGKYVATDPNALIDKVYVSKLYAQPLPNTIKVTIGHN